MKTTYIVDEIYKEFAKTYRRATPFVNSGDLWDFCIQVISNPGTMNQIILNNDHDIAPVKSLIDIYEAQKNPDASFVFTHQEAVCLGCLMGFVFRFVLGYKKKKKRCKVKKYGVTTAALFDIKNGEIFTVN